MGTQTKNTKAPASRSTSASTSKQKRPRVLAPSPASTQVSPQEIDHDSEPSLPAAFYTERGVRLYRGDAIETLEKLPANSVDLIFADPPYNLSNGGFTCHAGKRTSVNKGRWDKSNGIDQDYEFHHRWIAACRRVLKENGSIWVSGTYHSIYVCGFALQKQGWHLLNEICWYKPNAAPHLACRMFCCKPTRHCFGLAKPKTQNTPFTMT